MKICTILICLTGLILGLVNGVEAQVTEEWVARYNGPGNGLDAAYSLALDGNGNVYVTGESEGSGTGYDYATIKYNSAGVQQWIARYNGLGNSADNASSLAVDGNGNVYVTGSSYGGINSDYATVKYNSAGVQQWVTLYNGLGNDWDLAISVAVDGNGNVYVTGSSYGGINSDYATVKYNSAGVQQWEARYNGLANGDDYAVDLAIDGNNNVYVTGYSPGIGTGSDYATIKYNSAGVQQWVVRYNGPGNGTDYASSLAVDGNGNVYVTGQSLGSATGNDYATVKYNSVGVQQWVGRYTLPGNSLDAPKSLAVDGNGNVYVTGLSTGSGVFTDYATIKYNSAGVQQWEARYTGPGDNPDAGYSLALDGIGNVYVTGMSYVGNANADCATIKYNSAGIQQWVMTYNGPASGMDYGVDLAIGSDNVYVTGYSPGIGTGFYDYATIKYSQAAPQTLDVTLIAINPPITVPANGGSFQFNVSMQRIIGPQAPYTVWCRIKNPDGTYTAPTLGPVTINTPVGTTVTRQRTQSVPGTWAAGLYTYLGYVNPAFAYPAVDSSSFTFTKSATSDGGGGITDAVCTGDLFPGEETVNLQPTAFSLLMASPNPFNPITAISFKLQASSYVSLKVYDIAGRLVAKLVDGRREAGTHEATFDGSALASGIYLAKLEAGKFTATQKLVLLK